jgi:general stress protein YciG
MVHDNPGAKKDDKPPENDENSNGGEMSVREAGKKGGDTVRNRYGSGFYEKIGRKGGQVTRERHGAEFYEAIGQKGGKVVKEKYGADFYEEIGHKGGQKVKQLIADAKKTAQDLQDAKDKAEKEKS